MNLTCKLAGHDVVRIVGPIAQTAPSVFTCRACGQIVIGERAATEAGTPSFAVLMLASLVALLAVGVGVAAWAVFTFGPLWDWVRG